MAGSGRSRTNLNRRHAVPEPIFSPHRPARHNTASRGLERTRGWPHSLILDWPACLDRSSYPPGAGSDTQGSAVWQT